MMKAILTACMAALFLTACKPQPDSKAIKKEVLNIHDKLMIDGEKVIKNRMRLDTLLRSGKLNNSPDSVLQKLAVSSVVEKLNNADESMMDWMHFFKDDYKGKTEEDDLNYYKSQMIKIRAVEDNFIKVTRESDSLLKIYKIIPAEKSETQKHNH